MVQPGLRVLVGVSGGPDSVALFDLFAREAEVLGIQIAVAHLDHALRPGSGDDRQFVEELARRIGCLCFSDKENVRALARSENRSLEEAGRAARSRFFVRVAREWGASRVALGHQRDDQAEGVLMRILQGSGSSGLASIRPMLRSAEGLWTIRPLLDASRAQILDYCARRELLFRTDETNDDPAFLRNRTRTILIPLLEREFNPKAREALARSAEILRDEDETLRAYVADWMARHGSARSGGGPLALPRTDLAGLPIALRRRVIREALILTGAGPRKLRFDQIQTILDLVSRSARGRVVLANGFEVLVEEDSIIVGQRVRQDAPAGGWSVPLVIPGVTALPPDEKGVPRRLLASVLDRDDLKERLSAGDGSLAHLDYESFGTAATVRTRWPGDRFRPLGGQGSRKLNDFLIDARAPRLSREDIPLILTEIQGPDDGTKGKKVDAKRGCGAPEQIAWVVGVRISEKHRVTDSTKRVLRIEMTTDKAMP